MTENGFGIAKFFRYQRKTELYRSSNKAAMKERKIPEDLDCGLNVVMKIIGGKWKPCIIIAINMGFTRPSKMHRAIPQATPRVIDMQLRELEQLGIVNKQTFFEVPLRTEYSLTEEGRTLLPLIDSLQKWGNAYKHLVTANRQPVVCITECA
jgi:DNA-binding HxlR family transcriptional regulator